MTAQSNTGGITSKLGNTYEAKWLAQQLLDVIGGHADWLRFEGVTSAFAGFEASIHREGSAEWHQTKMNAPRGNWTVAALEREQILSAFQRRLSADRSDVCVFVSQDPAHDMRRIAEKASLANTEVEFFALLSKPERDAFEKLEIAWGVSSSKALDWLSRSIFQTIPEDQIDSYLKAVGGLLFEGEDVFGDLRIYLEERFNKYLTTELVRTELREYRGLRLKHWSLDRTTAERMRAATDRYLESIGGPYPIRRSETATICGLLDDPKAHAITLLSGSAGSGKSSIVASLIRELRRRGLPHLAFRIDHHLDIGSSDELGDKLFGIRASPAVALKGLSPDSPALLIADQIDVVSDVSGRSGATKGVILELVKDIEALKTVRILLVCRSFDLGSDSGLKRLRQNHAIAEIEASLLEWDKDVRPLLMDLNLDPDRLTVVQRDLLRLPLHLGLFLELKGESGHFASRRELFDAVLARKNRLLKQRGASWSVYEPLNAAVAWMSNHQSLDAPLALLDQFAGAVELLSSEDIIRISQKVLSLFHESLFDHIYARNFTIEGHSVLKLLTAEGAEQHLFRRTQTRQIFEALRELDRSRYIRELREVLRSESVRFHIKHAICQWLSSLPDPTRDEMAVFSTLDRPSDQLPPLSALALFGSDGWFDLLNREGWLNQELEGADKVQDQILWWLSEKSKSRAAEVATLLDAWWQADPKRRSRLLRWLGFVSVKADSPSLASLCENVVRAGGAQHIFSRSDMILSGWIGSGSSHGPQILKVLTDAWFENHPGQHPLEFSAIRDIDLHDLHEFAKRAPASFLDGAIPLLVRSLVIVAERERDGVSDFALHFPCRYGEVFGVDKLIAVYRGALCKVAAEDPVEARRLLAALPPNLHGLIVHLHLEAIAASNGALADCLPDLLDQRVEEAGWDGAAWKSFADAGRASFPCLSPSVRARIEDYIISIRPELRVAVDMARHISVHGEDRWFGRAHLISQLNRVGIARWATLETIGEDLLSRKGRAALDAGRRKFEGIAIPLPNQTSTGWVGSPIPEDRISIMSDAHWLRAIAKYSSNEGRSGRHHLEGGALQLAGQLQQLSKGNPRRCLALFKSIPTSANSIYRTRILWGFAESDAADIAIVADAVAFVRTLPTRHYDEAIVRLFERHPEIAVDRDLLQYLLWLGEFGEANEDSSSDDSRIEQEMLTLNDLVAKGSSVHIRGLNSVRGAAAEALASVIWKVPSSIELAWDFIERRIANEPLTSIRCCLTRPLLPLFNADKLRCARALEALVTVSLSFSGQRDNRLAPLATNAGVQLTPYIVAQVVDIGRRIIELLLSSERDTFRLIGVWHAVRASYGVESYRELSNSVSDIGVQEKRLSAAIAASAAVHDPFRDTAEQNLAKYFNDDDVHVRSAASDVFREIAPENFTSYRALAEHFVGSKAFIDEGSAFLRFVEKGTGVATELVIAAAERLARIVGEKDSDHGRRFSEMDTLYQLIVREYAATEYDDALRRRLLDVIDVFLEGAYYGSGQIVAGHDR